MNKPSNHYIHGYAHTRIDNIYKNMISRCYYPKNNRYKNYGARGIKVCEEWRKDRRLFYKWAYDNGYSDDLSIDRIDVNGNYSPENCRWSTVAEQNNNRTSNHYLVIGNERRSIAEWSRISKVKSATISARLRYGWSAERAVFEKTSRCLTI